jgi:hypothetical protein
MAPLTVKNEAQSSVRQVMQQKQACKAAMESGQNLTRVRSGLLDIRASGSSGISAINTPTSLWLCLSISRRTFHQSFLIKR